MFACLYIPDFPVESIVRSEPLLRERAVAVLEGKPPLARLIALNEKARSLGMDVGMTKLQAAVFAESAAPANSAKEPTTRLRSDRAVLRQRSPEQEIAAHAALLDIAHAFTPRVEDTAPDTLLLDLAGLERLYGAPAKMASDLAARVAILGMEAHIAVAANPDAAMHAARGFDGITVIPPGSEAQRLGILPLPVLLDGFEICCPRVAGEKAPQREKLLEQMLDTLERWGVRDFRTLALLPEHALTSRLGEAGAQLRRLARGESTRLLVLSAPPSQFEEVMELECPVETIESLSFILNRLLDHLCARLEARALAAHELRLRLQLERRVADEETTTLTELGGICSDSHNVALKPVVERILRLPVSMRDAKVFLKLLQLELAAHPPGASVTKIWILAVPAPPRSAQCGLFLPALPEEEKLEITLARISAVVGERRAGIVKLLNTHRRDSFHIDRFSVAADGSSLKVLPTLSDAVSQTALALRLLRPACLIRVQLSEGRPKSLATDTRQTNRDELQGNVVWSAGPWHSSGDWWTENTKRENPDTMQSGPWDREEWDVAITRTNGNRTANSRYDIVLYRIYRDRATDQWFADASYD